MSSSNDPKDPKNSLFFLSAIDKLRDPQRTSRWRVLIPDDIWQATGIKPTNGLAFDNIGDDFALHVKTCQIPTIELVDDKQFYMGFGSHFVVNATIDALLPFEAIMLEDMRAYEMMLAWSQNCLNTGLLMPEKGDTDRVASTGLKIGLGAHKDIQNPTHNVLRNSTIKVELYNWIQGAVTLRLNLINAFPKVVEGPKNLSYEQAALAKFNFSLQCDRWSIEVPKQYATGKVGGANE